VNNTMLICNTMMSFEDKQEILCKSQCSTEMTSQKSELLLSVKTLYDSQEI
jgi:hypothetical protein